MKKVKMILNYLTSLGPLVFFITTIVVSIHMRHLPKFSLIAGVAFPWTKYTVIILFLDGYLIFILVFINIFIKILEFRQHRRLKLFSDEMVYVSSALLYLLIYNYDPGGFLDGMID